MGSDRAEEAEISDQVEVFDVDVLERKRVTLALSGIGGGGTESIISWA